MVEALIHWGPMHPSGCHRSWLIEFFCDLQSDVFLNGLLPSSFHVLKLVWILSSSLIHLQSLQVMISWLETAPRRRPKHSGTLSPAIRKLPLWRRSPLLIRRMNYCRANRSNLSTDCRNFRCVSILTVGETATEKERPGLDSRAACVCVCVFYCHCSLTRCSRLAEWPLDVRRYLRRLGRRQGGQ